MRRSLALTTVILALALPDIGFAQGPPSVPAYRARYMNFAALAVGDIGVRRYIAAAAAGTTTTAPGRPCYYVTLTNRTNLPLSIRVYSSVAADQGNGYVAITLEQGDSWSSNGVQVNSIYIVTGGWTGTVYLVALD